MGDLTPTVTKPWLSKTLIANALVAAAMLIPVVNVWVSAHPEAIVISLTGLNAVLRLLTKNAIGLND